jgi:Fur family peroxide stress response transcriptional regulator
LRLAVLAYLEADPGHPSAQQIFAALRPSYPSLSLSTVYETVDAFLEAGICRSLAGQGALLRVDGTSEPHDHAVCRQCGRIFDVAEGVWQRPAPPGRLAGGLAVTGMRVEFEVVCSECAMEGTPREPGRHPAPPARVPARGTLRRSSSSRGADRRRGKDRRAGPDRRNS